MDPSLVQDTWDARDLAGPDRRPPGPVERVLKTLAAILLLVWLYAAIPWRPWDRHMGAAAAGRALTARVHNGGTYICEPLENDGSILLRDVDYVCNATNKPMLSGYWIGTDGDSITEVMPNG